MLNKVPSLKCKSHEKDTFYFCKSHKDWLCDTCLLSHVDHFVKLAPGTNKDVKSLLDKSYEVLLKKNQEIV